MKITEMKQLLIVVFVLLSASSFGQFDKFVFTDQYKDYTKLGKACYDGDIPLVEQLLKEGCNPKTAACDNEEAVGTFCYDLLYISISKENLAMFTRLIELGQDPHIYYTEQFITTVGLVCWTVENEALSLEMLKILMAKGVMVDGEKNIDGWVSFSPIQVAISANKVKLVKLLLEHNADMSLIDIKQEINSAMRAGGRQEMIDILVEQQEKREKQEQTTTVQ